MSQPSKKLEQVVNSLEEGDLSLEECLKAFAKGTKLSKVCEDRLAEARKKVQVLSGDQVEPFPWDEADE